MSASQLNQTNLYQAMKSGALIITPNQRLSHFLITDFFKCYPDPVQHKPTCLSYQNFLVSCYDLLIHHHPFENHPRLLKPHHLQVLWQQITQQSSSAILNASLAAWQTCKTYGIPFSHEAFTHNPQTAAFQDWGIAFERKLTTLNAIAPIQLVRYLKSYPLAFTQTHVIFAYFDDFTPEQLALQTLLTEHTIHVDTFDLPPHQQQTYCFAAPDEKEEQTALLNWLKLKVKTDDSIGIVVPSLSSSATQLKRTLQLQLPDTSVHVSLGQVLSQAPLVSHALQWLTLNTTTLSLEAAQSLLQSPYLIGTETEHEARAGLAFQEREINYQNFTQALILESPQLAERLTTLPDYPSNDTPSNWITHFTHRLMHLGFPGQTKLNSTVYQTYERLLSLFDAFKALSWIVPDMTYQTALSTLQSLAANTVFQAEAKEAQVHVLGLLEAAGLPFKHLWIMGLTDQCLPSHTTPTPFIPLDLQRAYHLPHTDLTHETALAQLRLTRFQNASSETILSYPKTTGDVVNRPSPLLHSFPPYTPIAMQPARAHQLDYYDDTASLPPLTNEALSHGTSLLSDQAKCPFRAFAAHRLRLKQPEPLSEGLPAKTRGILLHQVMELLWQQLKTQTELLELDDSSLEKLIDNMIHKTLLPLKALPQALHPLEAARLKRLVHQACLWEKTRAPFKIEALESNQRLTLGPLTFKLRLDRIDRLGDHEQWIIDYKTSLPTPLPWHSDTPLEPQLLMYALIDPKIKAILFHELKQGRSKIKGISAKKEKDLSVLKRSWEENKTIWRTYLTQLATQFHEGECSPQPANETLCTSCAYQRVCRLPFKRI